MTAIQKILNIPVAFIMAAFMLASTAPVLALQKTADQPSEAKLAAVARAYLRVTEIQDKYKPKMESAKSAEKKQQIEQQANQEMVAAIEAEKGVTVKEYNQILTAAKDDDQLTKRLAIQIQKLQKEKEKASAE